MKKCAFLFAVILSLVGSAQGATMRMEGEVKATSIKVTPAPTPTALATAAAGVSGMDVTSGDAPDCTFSDTDPATKNDKGGTGGGISIKTGKGAAVTGSGLADDGGEGGLLTLEAAPGGASSNGKGGSGGLIWLKAGNGGAGAGGDLAKQGNGGAIFLTPGTGLIPGFVVIRGSYISQSDNNDYPPVVQNKAYNGHSNPTTPPYLPETVQCGVFEMDRLRGDFGGPLLICNGDWMGQVRFAGCGQTTGPNAPHLVPGADIIGVVESGTISLNSMPGRLELRSTSENTSNPVTRLKVRQDGIVEICNGPVNADPQIDNEMHFLDSSSGAYLSAGGHWQEPSSRSRKRNISVVDKKAAWDALDAMAPVDYEYKKQELCVEMNDGRILPFAQAEEEIRGRVIHSRRMTLDDVSKRTFTRLTEAGSGEWHRGFIAEDLPDKMVSADRKTISISDIAANNTAALKEAKSRIEKIEADLAKGKKGGGATTGSLMAGSLPLTGPLADAAGRAGVNWGDWETSASVYMLSQTIASEIAKSPWVEVAFADAWEWVDEVTETEAMKDVTLHRINWETMQIESYTTQQKTMAKTATGKKIKRLKEGVRFDEADGKCYRARTVEDFSLNSKALSLLSKIKPWIYMQAKQISQN